MTRPQNSSKEILTSSLWCLCIARQRVHDVTYDTTHQGHGWKTRSQDLAPRLGSHGHHPSQDRLNYHVDFDYDDEPRGRSLTGHHRTSLSPQHTTSSHLMQRPERPHLHGTDTSGGGSQAATGSLDRRYSASYVSWDRSSRFNASPPQRHHPYRTHPFPPNRSHSPEHAQPSRILRIQPTLGQQEFPPHGTPPLHQHQQQRPQQSRPQDQLNHSSVASDPSPERPRPLPMRSGLTIQHAHATMTTIPIPPKQSIQPARSIHGDDRKQPTAHSRHFWDRDDSSIVSPEQAYNRAVALVRPSTTPASTEAPAARQTSSRTIDNATVASLQSSFDQQCWTDQDARRRPSNSSSRSVEAIREPTQGDHAVGRSAMGGLTNGTIDEPSEARYWGYGSRIKRAAPYEDDNLDDRPRRRTFSTDLVPMERLGRSFEVLNSDLDVLRTHSEPGNDDLSAQYPYQHRPQQRPRSYDDVRSKQQRYS